MNKELEPKSVSKFTNGSKRVKKGSPTQRMLDEYREIRQTNPPGIIVRPHDRDLFLWTVNIVPTRGPQQVGRGTVHLHIRFLEHSFPTDAPKVTFVNPLFAALLMPQHSNETGETTDTVEPHWNEESSVCQLLLDIQENINHLENFELEDMLRIFKDLPSPCPRCDHTSATPYPPIEFIDPEIPPRGEVSLLTTHGNSSRIWIENGLMQYFQAIPRRTWRASHGINSSRAMYRVRICVDFSKHKRTKRNNFGFDVCMGWGGVEMPPESHVGMNTLSIGWEGVHGCWVFDENIKYKYKNHAKKEAAFRDIDEWTFYIDEESDEKMPMPYTEGNWLVIGIDFEEDQFVVAQEVDDEWMIGSCDLPDELQNQLLFPVISFQNCWFEIDFDFQWNVLGDDLPEYLRGFVSVEDWVNGVDPETLDATTVVHDTFDRWLELPREVSILLFSFCDEKDVLACYATNRIWWDLIDKYFLSQNYLVCKFSQKSFKEIILLTTIAGDYSQNFYVSHAARPKNQNPADFLPLVIDRIHGRKANDLIHRYLAFRTNQCQRNEMFARRIPITSFDIWLMVENLAKAMNMLVEDFVLDWGRNRHRGWFKRRPRCEAVMRKYFHMYHVLMHLTLRHPHVGVLAYNELVRFLNLSSRNGPESWSDYLIYLMIARVPKVIADGERKFQPGRDDDAFNMDDVTVKYEDIAVKIVVEFWIREVGECARDRPVLNDPYASIHDYQQRKHYKDEKNIECIRQIFRNSSQSRHILVAQVHFMFEAMRPDGKRGSLQEIYDEYNARRSQPSRLCANNLFKLMEQLHTSDIYKSFWPKLKLRCPLVEEFKHIAKWAVYHSKKRKYHEVALNLRDSFFNDVKNDINYPYNVLEVKRKRKKPPATYQLIKMLRPIKPRKEESPSPESPEPTYSGGQGRGRGNRNRNRGRRNRGGGGGRGRGNGRGRGRGRRYELDLPGFDDIL